MYDIFINGELIYIGTNQQETLEKALKIADENPYIDIAVLTWDDEEIFHMSPIE